MLEKASAENMEDEDAHRRTQPYQGQALVISELRSGRRYIVTE